MNVSGEVGRQDRQGRLLSILKDALDILDTMADDEVGQWADTRYQIPVTAHPLAPMTPFPPLPCLMLQDVGEQVQRQLLAEPGALEALVLGVRMTAIMGQEDKARKARRSSSKRGQADRQALSLPPSLPPLICVPPCHHRPHRWWWARRSGCWPRCYEPRGICRPANRPAGR